MKRDEEAAEAGFVQAILDGYLIFLGEMRTTPLYGLYLSLTILIVLHGSDWFSLFVYCFLVLTFGGLAGK